MNNNFLTWKSHDLRSYEDFNRQIWHSLVTNISETLVDFQKYVDSRDNSYTQDGILFIRPTVTSTNNYGAPLKYDSSDMVYSARLSTLASLLFIYGRLEIRAKLPTGDWLWPALWLMPKEKNAYGEWPRCGEIDLMESRGNRKLIQNDTNIGAKQIGTTLHFGPARGFDGWRHAHFTKNQYNLNTEFHIYTLIWSPFGFEFYLDDDLIGTIYPPFGGFWELGEFEKQTNFSNPWEDQSYIAPFDQYFYIIMNIAVGGISGYFPDNAENLNYKKPWKNTQPETAREDFFKAKRSWLRSWPYMNENGEDSAMQIDYVRLYAL
ncbi:beta-1,3-glucan-binding protein-like [Chrysoperla carnea]|uniref:beta-1,3-glucan-binding protein-like n=1 Tax=Chrysoperla carnea TaxID=189513 RepID=UPI001D075867|nr:beta-1,3-glucan-binding protein-like [Chrysoperla carnea]